MGRTAYQDHQFLVARPACVDGAWWFEVRGQQVRRHGPFADEAGADHGAFRLFQRWNERARSQGGWAWKRTPRVWMVTLPEALSTGGLAPDRLPCSVYVTPEPAP